MRRFIVTLKQLNNTEVVAIVDATTKGEATRKALGSANNIAKGGQSKVIISEKPLEVVRVEAWEDCSLRVVKGEKQYGVLLITQQGSFEDIVRGVAGIKSAYAYAIKQSGVQKEIRVYIYDLEETVNLKLERAGMNQIHEKVKRGQIFEDGVYLDVDSSTYVYVEDGKVFSCVGDKVVECGPANKTNILMVIRDVEKVCKESEDMKKEHREYMDNYNKEMTEIYKKEQEMYYRDYYGID